jgi:hypothetical protein
MESEVERSESSNTSRGLWLSVWTRLQNDADSNAAAAVTASMPIIALIISTPNALNEGSLTDSVQLQAIK